MSFLEFQSITKKLNKRLVLNNLSLEIKEGEIFGIIGASGCGKTTLLKILLGMFQTNSGKILFRDKNVTWNKTFLRQNTGLASQENMLYNELSLKENIYYFAGLYKVKHSTVKEKSKELLTLFGLKDYERYLIRDLSGGMQKRANILVSMIHDPALLLLDEPTVGLDPILRETTWGYIQKINKLGKTIIVTSHLLEELEKNCTRIGIMSNGEFILTGTIKQLKQRYPKLKDLNEILREVLT